MLEPSERPTLSVVLATTHPWPEIAPCLDRLLPQAARVGAEIIVGDGDGGGVPEGLPGVRTIVLPGASVFELRAAATQVAVGDVIALTEDHCIVAEDWCERILEAHVAHPEAALIGGAVRNGSTRRLSDWANFLLTFSLFMPPFVQQRGDRVPPPANVSVKRRFVPDVLGIGDLEVELPRRLHEEGLIVMDDSIEVAHVQSPGALGMLGAHYHNGRSTAGLSVHRAPRSMRSAHRRRALRAMPRLVGTVARDLRRRATPVSAWLSLPLVAGAVMAHTIGELVGSARGQGRSPTRLE